MGKQGHIVSFLREQDGVGIVEIILILVGSDLSCDYL